MSRDAFLARFGVAATECYMQLHNNLAATPKQQEYYQRLEKIFLDQNG